MKKPAKPAATTTTTTVWLRNVASKANPVPLPTPGARRYLRRSCGLTLDDCADALGTTPDDYRRIERDRELATHDSFQRLLGAMQEFRCALQHQPLNGRPCPLCTKANTAERSEGQDVEQADTPHVEPISEVDSLRSQVATLTEQLAILQRQADALAFVRAYSFPPSDPEYSQSFMASLKGRSHLSDAQIAVVEQIRDQTGRGWTRLVTTHKGRRTTVLLRPAS